MNDDFYKYRRAIGMGTRPLPPSHKSYSRKAQKLIGDKSLF